MPFSMSHLIIAHQVTRLSDKIKSPSDFILGAIAPDAIHFKSDFNYDMKKTSHLIVDDAKWGRVTRNDEWLENMKSYLQNSKESDNLDFIRGYCCHILADIQNNKTIWTPFRIENHEALMNGLGSQYHKESTFYDYNQYLTYEYREEIWKLLEDANAYGLEGLVEKTEVETLRHAVLNEWYSNRERGEVSSHNYVREDVIEPFIKVCVEEVLKELQL